MARLVVNPNTPAAWEIQLKPGQNFIGRGFSNDFKLADPSVSGSHCQITLSDNTALIKDLGSTNGTFVNRQPIKEAVLKNGETVHLGGVEMVYYSAAAAPAAPGKSQTTVRIVARPPIAPARAPVASPGGIPTIAPRAGVAAPALATAGAARLSAPPPPVAAPAAEPAGEEGSAVPPPIPSAAPVTHTVPAGPCKHHPKTQGRFFCNHCRVHYCELCVNTRAVGGVSHRYCRHCGSECLTAQVQAVRPQTAPSFFSRLPSSFIYPFKGSGVLVLIVSAMVFTALEFMSGGLFGILFTILAAGYLFSYMQNIIHSTASEDDQMPELPGFDGLFGAFGRLAGAVLMSFGITIVVGILALQRGEAPNVVALVGSLAFGALYFPMALLAVAMKDSIAAANPLIVVPAILKVPLEYLITVIVMAVVIAFRLLGEGIVASIAAKTYTTRDMSVLFTALGVRAFWSLATVYLLSVNMRVLGLLYVSKKQKLGWFSR